MNTLLAKTATQTDAQIVTHMTLLEKVVADGPEQRMIWAALVDTLAGRHPELNTEIDAIYEADIEDDDLHPAIILAAAKYAA